GSRRAARRRQAKKFRPPAAPDGPPGSAHLRDGHRRAGRTGPIRRRPAGFPRWGSGSAAPSVRVCLRRHLRGAGATPSLRTSATWRPEIFWRSSFRPLTDASAVSGWKNPLPGGWCGGEAPRRARNTLRRWSVRDPEQPGGCRVASGGAAGGRLWRRVTAASRRTLVSTPNSRYWQRPVAVFVGLNSADDPTVALRREGNPSSRNGRVRFDMNVL